MTVMATHMPVEVFLTWMIPNQTTYLPDNTNGVDASATTTTTTAKKKKKEVLPRYTIVLNEFMENVRQELQPEVVQALYKHLHVDKGKQRRLSRLFGMQKSVMDRDNKTHEAAQQQRQQRRQQRSQLKQNSQQWNKQAHLCAV